MDIMKLHLHMFDDTDMTRMNTNVTTQNTTGVDDLSPEMKTYYDKVLLRAAEPKLVHDQFGQKRPIPAHGGKTIEFRRFPALPKMTTPLTEGVTPDGQKLRATAIPATIAQYGGYVVSSDLLELTAIDNIMVETAKLLGSQAGRTSDTITREVLAACSNVQYANDKSARANLAATDVLTVAEIKKARRALKARNTETINGDYIAIIHPDAEYDLMCDDEWIDASKYAGSEQIFEGEIGKIFGVRFVESTEAKIFTQGTIGSGGFYVYGTLVLGANAFGVTSIEGKGIEHIVKQKGSAGTNDPLDQRSSQGWKLNKVAVILDDNYIVRIEHRATYSSTPS